MVSHSKKMMLRTVLVCLVSNVIFFSSCDYIPAKKRLLVYTQISATNDTLDRLTREWHQLLRLSTKDKNFFRLKQCRIKIGQFLSRNRPVVANLRVRPDSQPLIDSEEAFLANQATIATDVYTPFESYNEMTPNDLINTQLKAVVNDLSTEIAGKAAMDRSLQAYIVRNKIKLKQ
jgi:hypothetical protein